MQEWDITCHMVSDDSAIRMHVLFSGRVQGVGFRFAVCRIAESFSVEGYVRNLYDGSVELIAEGATRELKSFLETIRASQLRRYITDDRVEWETATGEYGRFGISY